MRIASATLALLLFGLATLCLAMPPKGGGMTVDVAVSTLVQAGGTGARAVHGQGRDCQGCHAQETQRGHPSGFVAQRELPPGLRLEPDGRFTCRTCHDAQFAGRSLPTCGQCHDPAFFAAMADGGTSLRGRAHPAVLDTPATAGFDPRATACLGCHMDHGENSYASGLMYAGSRSTMRNHPVGMRYERAAAYGGYVPAAVLPPEVRLLNGRLSCLSCHRSYSARHGVTVLPTAGSRLCFACHDL